MISQQSSELLEQYFHQVCFILLVHLLEFLDSCFLSYFGILVFLGALEEFLTDHDTFHTIWCLQRSIFRITGFITEDGAKKFLFRCRITFSFWSDLTDED